MALIDWFCTFYIDVLELIKNFFNILFISFKITLWVTNLDN